MCKENSWKKDDTLKTKPRRFFDSQGNVILVIEPNGYWRGWDWAREDEYPLTNDKDNDDENKNKHGYKQKVTNEQSDKQRKAADLINISNYSWKSYCHGLFQLPSAA